MATKTFTKEMEFNRNVADQLIEALNANTTPNRQPIKNVKMVTDKKTIQKMFGVKTI